MLFFMDLGGDVLRIDAERIYQGSNDGARLQLITPITPSNTSIEVAFQYPNGLVTTYYPMAIVGRYSLQDIETTDLDNYGNIQVYMWQISLLPNVTVNAGTVVVTFKVTKPANVEAYASTDLFPETGESGVYYVCDGVYYEWQNGAYVETTDTIDIINNTYRQVATSPCPFTVEYAALPSPPQQVTTSEIEQILTLLNQYYSTLSGTVIDNTEAIEGLDTRLTAAEGDIDSLQDDIGDINDLIDALNDRVTDAEGQVGDMQETVDDVNERMTTVESEFGEVKDAYDSVVGDISDLGERMTTAEGEIDDLQAAVGDGTGTTSLTARMTQAETDIDDLSRDKMDKTNPRGFGSLSIQRYPDSTVGDYSVTVGYQNKAATRASYAEGYITESGTGKEEPAATPTLSSINNYGSHAEGYTCYADGAGAHAEGVTTLASYVGAHAEGLHTIASYTAAHAEGDNTEASSQGAHAEGIGTLADGVGGAHAEGRSTIASGASQHVSGRYNIEDSFDTYAEIIGNGTSNSARSNARTLDWQGNETLAGNITVNKTTLTNTASGAISVNLPSGAGTIALTSQLPTTPQEVGADPAGTATSAVSSHNTDTNAHSYIQGLVSTAQQKADDAYSLAEGRENAISYADYQAMVTAFNAEASATLKVGDNVYIETVGVPDLWVSDVLTSKVSYTYTTDQAIVDALDNPSIGYINIGWYRLDQLETAKVDLSGYVPTSRTVNGHALSSNVTVTASDVGLGNLDNVRQYSASNPPPYPVTSVNTKTGAVTLGKSDIGLGNVDNVQQYSANNPPPYPVTSVNGDTGDVTITIPTATSDLTNDSGFITSADLPTVNNKTITIQKNGTTVESFTLNQSSDETINITMSKSDVGLSNVDNVQQYSASNPPPYPVTDVEVNGASVVSSGVAAVTVPTKVSELQNDSGFITAAQVNNPVTSVNGQTGDVVLSIPTKTSDLTNDSGFITSSALTPYLEKTGGTISGNLDVTGTLDAATIKENGTALSTKYTLKTDFDKVVDGTTQVGDAAKLNGQSASYYTNYNNFSNKPTIGDATITIQKNGVAVDSFTANATTNTTVNITMDKTDVGLGSVDNVQQYSASNPPPYPVTSVNGSTGAVTGLATSNSNLLINSNFAINQRAGYYAPFGATVYADDLATELGTVRTAIQTSPYNSTWRVATSIPARLGTQDITIATGYIKTSDCVSGYVGNDVYGVDRWRSYGNPAIPVSNGLKMTGNGSRITIWQPIEDFSLLWGETVTLTLCIDNTIYTQTGTIPSTIPTANNSNLFSSAYANNLRLRLGYYPAQNNQFRVLLDYNGSNTVVFNYAKLEIGAVATKYTQPLISEELSKCQRYYIDLSASGNYSTTGCVTTSSKAYYMPLFLPTTMRVLPTVDTTHKNPQWRGRKAAGGYSAHASSFVDFTTISMAGTQVSPMVCDTISASSGDTNNSVIFYEINNLALDAEI